MITPGKKVLIIVGMHRSGTSLVTQWLYKCGLHVGDHLMEASIANVQGHFEDLDFVNAHVNMLRKKRLKASGLTVYNIDNIDEQNKAELKKIIQQKNKEHDEWGWKDPRTCLFLDTYAALIPRAFYLVVIRNFEETISSLIARQYKESVKKYQHKKGVSKWIWEFYKKKRRMHSLCKQYAAFYLKVWIHYNEQILRLLKTLPETRYMVVHSALLAENDTEVYAHLTNVWNFSLHYYSFNNVYTASLWGNKADVLSYIKDKQLLARAYGLQQELQNYSTVLEPVLLNY